MNQIAEAVVPVFGMAMIGFAAGRFGLLDKQGARGLEAFSLKLAIPIMLFTDLSRMEIPSLDPRGMLAYYTSCAVIYMAAAWSAKRFGGLDHRLAGSNAMAAAFSNTVLLAFPILQRLHGDQATLLLLLIISCHTTFLFLLGTVYLEAGQGSGRSPMDVAKSIARGMLANPIIVALILGLAANIAGFQLTGILGDVAVLFKQAAVPTALFALGLSLCGYKLLGSLKTTLTLSTWKLILHPLVMWLLARYVFNLSPLWTTVTVIAAAMPAGINSYIFANINKAGEETAAATVLFTTAAGIFTVSLLLMLL